MRHGKKKMAESKLAGMWMVLAVLFMVPAISMGAVLEATPDHIEFGTVDEGDPVVAVSEIVNTGSTPVEITNVRTS